MEERVETHMEFLVDRIDPDFGLLDKLLARESLTREVLHRIKLQGNTSEDKNRILLDFILKNRKTKELVSALIDSGQTHLVNYLKADGGYESEFGDNWPISVSDIRRLEINRGNLVDVLETIDLCDRMLSEKVINNRQREFICSKQTNAERNEALLDTLTKFSVLQYQKTITCMKDSNQSHVVDEYLPCYPVLITTTRTKSDYKENPNVDYKENPVLITTTRTNADYKENPKVDYKEDPVLITTTRTKAAEEHGKGISGLAIADNDLFITSFQTKEIEVFDLKSLTLTLSWRLDPLINPWDLGYCNKNKCLYIMDVKYLNVRKKMLRVDRSGKLLSSWTTRMGYGCISVTYDCNVLMADYEGYTITEYTPDGRIAREIKLSTPAGFAHPRHAIKLSNDQFLMSHGEGEDPLHRVCVLDNSGDIQMSFGGQSGSNADQLFVPIFLAIDSSGSIIVVDRDNSRVLLLSSDLKFIREIISGMKAGMDRPERMVFDQANGRLLVAHNDPYWSECQVFVFEIQ